MYSQGPDGAQDARVGITPMPDLRRCSPLAPLTTGRGQTAFPTRAPLRPASSTSSWNPVERLARDAVLSQKEAQSGRMFLHVAHGKQEEF